MQQRNKQFTSEPSQYHQNRLKSAIDPQLEAIFEHTIAKFLSLDFIQRTSEHRTSVYAHHSLRLRTQKIQEQSS